MPSGYWGIELISYPILLIFIAFFLIAFGSYLSVTHKGFEEVLWKNLWSELSYIFAFIAFILVYFIYTSLKTDLQRFPYHDFAFIGYFAVLIIEILSTKTLVEKLEDIAPRKGDITPLLNFYAHNFLRADYLEALWDKTLSEYVDDEARSTVIFDPSQRDFNLEEADERTKLTVAIRMLLEMHKIPDGEKIMIQRKTVDEVKEDIVHILEEQILLLPDELRAEFDERTYYPILFEKAVNELLLNLKTFIPLSEHELIFERLKRRDELFNCIRFENEGIVVAEGTLFSRDDFLKLFKLYLEVLGEKFPFKRCLLRGLVKEEIAKDLQTTISAGDVFDVVPTGSKEIDLVIAGGLVKGTATVLITEETKAKQKILVSFIKKGLKEGIIVIYATSKRPFEQVIGELRMEAAELKKFMLLDLHENLYAEDRVSELVEEKHRTIVPLNKILFQRSFVKAIKSQPRNVPKIVILDVYDDFSRHYSPDEIFELLQNQMEGLKRWNCTSLIVFDPYSYLIKKEGINEVKRHFDNIMIISGEDKDTRMFIEKLYHGTPSKPIIHLPW
jgi:KaiC/GvpD/RAD55 family RecA-like ATPase